MAYVEWKKLMVAQRLEATKLRPKWHLSDFKNFAFWVKPDGHLSRRGGHHEMTKGAYDRIMARYAKLDRVKGDLADWKPGVTFHFDNQHRRDAKGKSNAS